MRHSADNDDDHRYILQAHYTYDYQEDAAALKRQPLPTKTPALFCPTHLHYLRKALPKAKLSLLFLLSSLLLLHKKKF
jgi:hypothetical protein